MIYAETSIFFSLFCSWSSRWSSGVEKKEETHRNLEIFRFREFECVQSASRSMKINEAGS